MRKRFSINGNRKETMIQYLEKDSFIIDSKYSMKKIIYETNYCMVALGFEYDLNAYWEIGMRFEYYQTAAVREIEIKKYIDLLHCNWNWNLSLKVLNELKVYNTLADKTKMVTLVDIMLTVKYRSPREEYRKIFNYEFKEIYLVFERHGNDLSSYTLSRKEQPPLEMNNNIQQWLLSELLLAVSSLHSQKLMHRDIRPSNVSVNFEKKTLKLKNFGLSSGFSSKVFLDEKDEVDEDDDEEEEDEEDEEKITPIYTAPEIILGKASTPLMDVWGVGCIFGEILSGGSPLFFVASGSKPTTPNKIGAIVTTIETQGSLDKLSSNPLAIDLLRRMLVFNPGNRISVEEAMQHSYFGGTKKEELVLGGSSSSRVVVTEITEPAIGVVEPDVHALRKLIWKEMETFEMNKKKTSEIPLMKKMKTCEG